MQFVPCFLFVVTVAATLQSTAAAGGGEPSSPLVANLPASVYGPKSRDFIQSLCEATCPNAWDVVQECFGLLKPYAESINRSNTRAARASVTVVVPELQALDKSVVEFNRTNGQDYQLGPCMQVIHEAANAGKQQLGELDAAGDGNQAALAKVNTWFQDVTAKIDKCDPRIKDVPRSKEVLNALLALAGVVSRGAGADTPADGKPSSPPVANLPASVPGPEAPDFIQSLCDATGPNSWDVEECIKLLKPYAQSINGSNTRAARTSVTVVVAELQTLDKNVVEFNRTDGQDYVMGPCMKVIREVANGGKQQLAELDAAGDGNQAALAKVNTWFQDVVAKINKCDPRIKDVPRSEDVLNALLALAGVVSRGAGADTPE